MKMREAEAFHHSPDPDVTSSTLNHHAFGNVYMCILSHILIVVEPHEQGFTDVLPCPSRVLHSNPLFRILIVFAGHAFPTMSVNWQAFHLLAEYAEDDHETTLAVYRSSRRKRQFRTPPRKFVVHVRSMKRHMQDLALQEIDPFTLLILLPGDVLGRNGARPARTGACAVLALTWSHGM